MQKKDYYQKFDKDYYTTDGYHDYLEKLSTEAEEITIPTIIDIIHPQKDWKFLDVGCSFGGNIIALQKHGFEARGTEISNYCLSASTVKDKMVFGEAFNLPFEDKSFDVIICMDVFMYLNKKEQLKAIQEFVRVASKYIV